VLSATRFAVADTAKPELYDLKYKLKVGEIIRCEVVHRATVETTIQENSQTSETRSKSIKAWKVTAATPDNITFVHSVESIDMWQRMQGRAEVTFNSLTDKTPPPGYEQAAAAVGVPLTEVTMNERGVILKRVQKHQQTDLQSPQIAMPLPAEPVAVGHVWTAPLEIEVVLTGGASRRIKTQQKFELTKVADGIAFIQLDTQVLTPISEPTIEAQLIQRLSSGVVQFDIDAGRVIQQDLDLDRRVLGFSGAASSMHYLTRFTEKLLPSEASKTALKSTPGKRN
jgi:hypothetical protein